MIALLPRRLRNRHLLALDAAALIIAPFIAFAVRFEELSWIGQNLSLVLPYIILTVPLRLVLFYFAGMYRRLWRHASIGELRQILLAGAGSAIVVSIVGLWLLPMLHLSPTRVPFSVAFVDAFLTTGAIALPRLLARTIRRKNPGRRRNDVGRPVLIVGAGDTAKQVVKDLYNSPQLNLDPIGFVDDDASKHGHMLYDLPVIGPISAIADIVEEYSIAELIIAMPSAPGSVVRKVVRAGLDCGIPTLTVPSLPEILSRQSASTALREVEIQDLLRRDPVETDLAAVAALATGRTVLVTGAGGSIGSELCRQVARLAPERMILVGHGENSIFDIAMELKAASGDVEFVPVIADVRNRARIASIMRTYAPYVVFHAAAHKHVPLMEENAIEAVTNNVVGTRNVVDAAVGANVDHFVFISTDKAVRPTSIMGTTKRISEQIVQHAALKHDRNFVSVRFGNVLGSRGSVVPTFLRQIRAGGPVTITHPEMQRFFMTIPEAVQLVLQAAAMGTGGEVFLLDMGEPVRIVDLATDLVRLSGLTLNRDIELKFTGMRPGEKLYEEMFFSGENVLSTEHPKVLRARNGILPEGTARKIDALVKASEKDSTSDELLRELLKELVPEFNPHPAPNPAAVGDRVPKAINA